MTDFNRATRTELLDQAQMTLEAAQRNADGVAESLTSPVARPSTDQVVELTNTQIALGTAWYELAKARWQVER